MWFYLLTSNNQQLNSVSNLLLVDLWLRVLLSWIVLLSILVLYIHHKPLIFLESCHTFLQAEATISLYSKKLWYGHLHLVLRFDECLHIHALRHRQKIEFHMRCACSLYRRGNPFVSAHFRWIFGWRLYHAPWGSAIKVMMKGKRQLTMIDFTFLPRLIATSLYLDQLIPRILVPGRLSLSILSSTASC